MIKLNSKNILKRNKQFCLPMSVKKKRFNCKSLHWYLMKAWKRNWNAFYPNNYRTKLTIIQTFILNTKSYIIIMLRVWYFKNILHGRYNTFHSPSIFLKERVFHNSCPISWLWTPCTSYKWTRQWSRSRWFHCCPYFRPLSLHYKNNYEKTKLSKKRQAYRAS